MAVKILPHKFVCYQKVTLLKCGNPVVLQSSVYCKFLKTSDGVTAASGCWRNESKFFGISGNKGAAQNPNWDSPDWIISGEQQKDCKGILLRFGGLTVLHTCPRSPGEVRVPSQSLHSAALHVHRRGSLFSTPTFINSGSVGGWSGTGNGEETCRNSNRSFAAYVFPF